MEIYLIMIISKNGKWFVYSKDGSKKLGGPYNSKKEAVVRLRQVEYFKSHKKKSYTYQEDRKMKNFGDIDDNKKIIRINSSKSGKGGVIDTILHEEIHRMYPDMTEMEVRKMAQEKIKKMSLQAQRNLLTKIIQKTKKK